ncbi:MAG: cytochrome c oxidase assembly protein, partial [Gemmobacter sp.]|nr:cytochrome c oxidase assembly protein [Gemmobacter sp.]
CAATVALFAARSVHHLILLCVIAPALATAMAWRPIPAGVGLGLTSATLILWHVPAVYDAAWDSAQIYWTLQGALLLPAWMFWSAVLRPAARADTLFGHALLVGGLAGVMGLIGAVLTFAPVPLYPQHLVGTNAFGIGLLSDQQLAGLIMWVPGFLPIVAVSFWMLRRGWKQGFAA